MSKLTGNIALALSGAAIMVVILFGSSMSYSQDKTKQCIYLGSDKGNKVVTIPAGYPCPSGSVEL